MLSWLKKKPQRRKNHAGPDGPRLVEWARAMELVDLRSQIVLVQVDVSKDLDAAVKAGDVEKARRLERAAIALREASAALM
jgi:hypothetical protein